MDLTEKRPRRPSGFYPFSIGWSRGGRGGNNNPWMSIKSMFNGPVTYRVQNGMTYVVDDSNYLVLNRGNGYTFEKSRQNSVMAGCVFFPPEMVADVVRFAKHDTLLLIDNPFHEPDSPELLERLYPHDGSISPILRTLVSEYPHRIRRRSTLNIEELLTEMLLRLLSVQSEAFAQGESIASEKASTRTELCRRLYRAKDYIAARASDDLSINEIANVACLSDSHLLVKFKELFGTSPNRYRMLVRLSRAKALLKDTDLPVSQVCLEVGFASHQSFTNLFTREVGVSPSRFRTDENS